MFAGLKRIRTRILLKNDARISVNQDTILRDDFRWDIREKKDINPCINIGKDCIIGGNLIIENERASIKIGDASTLGSGSLLVAADANIQIGNHVVMSFDITMYTTNSHSFDVEERHKDLYNTLDYLRGNSASRKINWSQIDSKDIIIEDDVWIGFGATILKGVKVGRGAIVGAKSVVTHDVEPFTVVAGSPARIVKRLEKQYVSNK